MPRDGSNIYTRPFPDVAPSTTIESAVYNGFTADVATDLNAPRPIIAGGTGATSALNAMINLKGEVALQVVTNYDSYAFVSGSFSSAAGATSAPTANAFSGIAVVTDASNMVIEARDATTGLHYVRRKVAGVWVNSGAWALDASDKVAKAGDTMTGNLTIASATPTILLNKTAAGTDNIVYSYTASKTRWAVNLGDAVAEGGSNAGSNFAIYRYKDDGSFNAAAMDINRATGAVNFYGNITTATGAINGLVINAGSTSGGSITTSYSTTGGTIYFGTTGVANNKYLTHDGTNYTLNGGPFLTGAILSSDYVRAANGFYFEASNVVRGFWNGSRVQFTHGIQVGGDGLFNNSVYAGFGSGGSGTYYFGSGGAKYLLCDGTNYAFSSGQLTVNGATTINGALNNSSGAFISYGGRIICHNDGVEPSISCWKPGYGTNVGFWNSAAGLAFGNLDGSGNPTANTLTVSSVKLSLPASTAEKPGGGPWTATSDIRIKDVLGDYTGGLDAITALHPVRYAYKGNLTTEKPTPERAAELISPHHYAAKERREFIGLIAQEAEIPMPEMVTRYEGYVDGEKVDDLRNLDTTALLFALVNAVKELNAKIKALEARG